MIKTFLLLPLALLFITAGAQIKLTPEIIAAGGGVGQSAGISLEWTLGEASIGQVSSSDRLYTVGFHQPVLIIDVAKTEKIKTPGITVFPNPVKDKLKVEINRVNLENITLVLCDMHGRTLAQKTVYGVSNMAEISFMQCLPGIYLLRAYDANKKLINTFKVTKGK